MIQDSFSSLAGGVQLSCSAPNAGEYIQSSYGIDLNPDYGQGVQPRRAGILGMGSEWVMRLDVQQSFVAFSGFPVVQFHLIVGNSGNATNVHLSTAYTFVGSSVGPTVLDATGTAQVTFGYKAADLVEGTHVFIRPNPFTEVMARSFPGNTAFTMNTARYLGIAITIPNYKNAAAFQQGTVTGHLVLAGDIIQTPDDFVYPVGTDMK